MTVRASAQHHVKSQPLISIRDQPFRTSHHQKLPIKHLTTPATLHTHRQDGIFRIEEVPGPNCCAPLAILHRRRRCPLRNQPGCQRHVPVRRVQERPKEPLRQQGQGC